MSMTTKQINSVSRLWQASRLALCLSLLSLAILVIPVTAAPETQTTQPRRVNVPYFSGTIDTSQAAIFWFGQNKQGMPSQNYVDVRMAYSAAGLYLRATVIDYYLWYKQNVQAGDDLTQYDALAIYLDTSHNRSATPQTDDYYFLVGLHSDGTAGYRRQARGTGSGWNTSWNPEPQWSDYIGWQWSTGGPNNNGGNIDYGWVGGMTIPWSAFGLSGPPAEETLWGLGVRLYDRDAQPPQGAVTPETWPESMNVSSPAGWGELHFGPARYTPLSATRSGSASIRAATPEDNVVEDAWMGGSNKCNNGHEGNIEANHSGNDQILYIGSEISPTHFPCYNKSYLRFALSSLPPGKVILSATLTLHHWGNAGDPNAPNDADRGHNSYVWLSSVTETWSESGIHWNNAPLAQENFSVTRIPPKTTPLVWPGDPYTWDATEAVAEAYTAGQSVSFAMYDSGTGRNTSKYLTASETGLGNGTPNWNIAGRPRLDIVWGDPAVSKKVEPVGVKTGHTITYTLRLLGVGQTLALTDTIPNALSRPLALNATFGAPNYNSTTRQLTWSGAPPAGQVVTITYAVTATVSGPLMVSNTVTLVRPGSPASASTAWVCVGCYPVDLPLIKR